MFACRMPRSVYGGENALEQLRVLCAGKKTVAVFSDNGIVQSGILERALTEIRHAGAEPSLLCDLPTEPTCDEAQKVIDAFRARKADMIVAVGGGSVMDIAKLCAITGDPAVTVRRLIDNPSLGQKNIFTVMIPTTAGTGAEATPNSIVAVPEKALKVGIVNDAMLPDAVILDPEMIRRVPMGIAASTGVDALCHAIECLTSKKATPFSDLYALEALKLIFTHIEKACMDADAMESKQAMQIAAYYAGVAITCSGTTAVHALSYPLGGRYHIAHGVANAMMLMPVMRFNFEACRADFARVYDVLGQQGAACEQEKAEWILRRMEEIVSRLSIPNNLQAYGVSLQDIDALVTAGMDVTRLLNNNKRTVTPEDARSMYLELLA